MSPMHRMTRSIEGARVAAPFQGESLRLGGDRATLEMHRGARFVRVDSDALRPSLFRVTRVLGGRHREDFVGVQVATEEDEATSPRGDELVLPVSYLIEKKRLRYKGYSVMVRERPRLAAGPVWNRTCAFCHNTVPLLSTLLGALAGPRASRYQGEVVDRLLPEAATFRYDVTDEGALDAALSREIVRLGAVPPAVRSAGLVRHALEITRDRFDGSKLLEVGIGCEACHGGCREHVDTPTVHPSLVPRAPYLQVRTGAPDDAPASASSDAETHACARCHQVLFSRYPWTWEGGRRNAMPGGSHISSGEARDLLLGGCRGALKCTACHDPHSADETLHLAALATVAGNTVCLSCHGALASKEALRAHAHHDPEGAGGACIACHMARKNMSLDGGLSRYHRIGSPSDPQRVLNDRPLECALCHVDKTVEQLAGTMERWWSKAYDRDALRSSYGDLGDNALRATLRRGKPHERAVAMFVLGTARDRLAAPLFGLELFDEYPLVRQYAADALRATFGDSCDVDVSQDRATLAEAISRCSRAAGVPIPGALPPGSPALPGSARPGGGSRGEGEPVED